MVSAHGGSISVGDAPKSDGLDGGALFTVLLPAGESDEAESELPRTDSDAAAGAAADQRHVLVIDDEPDITGFLVEVLEAEGHTVDVAASGQAALELLTQRDYAAIICDLRMPHMDGPGLYDALRKLKPHLLDRMIFATGDLLNEETGRFVKESGRPCIEKPFMPAQIRELVEEVSAGVE
jgi:CheY-like chemotaxis protein